MRYFLFIFVLCATINAADKFVSTSGVNTTARDGSIGQPWRTIGYGVSRMVAGDRLYIRAGNYEESGIVESGSTILWKDNSIIMPYPGESAVFYPTNLGLVNGSRSAMRSRSNRLGPTNVTVSGLILDNSRRPVGAAGYPMIDFQGGTGWLLSGLTIRNSTNGSGITMHGLETNSLYYPRNSIITGCTISNIIFNTSLGYGDGQVHGLYIRNASGITISSNSIDRFNCTAISVGSGNDHGSTNFLINANRIRNGITLSPQSAHGIYISNGSNHMVINNDIANVARSGIYLAKASNCYFAHNSVWGGSLSGEGQYHNWSSYVPGNNRFVNNIGWAPAVGSWSGFVPRLGVPTSYWTNNVFQNFKDVAGTAVLSGNRINISFNPQFVNPPTDLSIQTNGAAWQFGYPLPGIVTNDIVGTVRGPFWDSGSKQIDFGDPEVEPPGTPPVNVVADGPFALRNGLVPQTFTFTRSSTTGSVTAHFNITGTAVADTDYGAFANEVTFGAGVATAVATVAPLAGGSNEDVTVIVTLIDDPEDPDTYTKQDPITATITIRSVPADGSETRPPPGHRAYRSIL